MALICCLGGMFTGPKPQMSKWRGKVLQVELEFSASKQSLFGNVFAYQKSWGGNGPSGPGFAIHETYFEILHKK